MPALPGSVLPSSPAWGEGVSPRLGGGRLALRAWERERRARTHMRGRYGSNIKLQPHLP